jgi:hypothetical protein
MSIAVCHYQNQLFYARIDFQPLCNHLRAAVSNTISSLQRNSESGRSSIESMSNQVNSLETHSLRHTYEAQ